MFPAVAVFRPRFGDLRLCLLASCGSENIPDGVWCAPRWLDLEYDPSNFRKCLTSRKLTLAEHLSTAAPWDLRDHLRSAGLLEPVTSRTQVLLASLPALSVFLATNKATRAVWASRLFHPTGHVQALEQLMKHADPSTADVPNGVPDDFAAVVAQVIVSQVRFRGV